MIVLKYTKTHENCPKGCKSISYLNDDQEHKDCIECGVKWNRLTNKVVKEVVLLPATKIYTQQKNKIGRKKNRT